tara:strand:- start:2599 stop:3366 length:768 start_codon:yes stop_codon:yes gene_type:complete
MSEKDDIFETISIDGFTMSVYKNDNCISECLRKGQFWDKQYFDAYDKLYVRGKDILDVGGFIGTNTLLFSKLLSEGNKIHTFEPLYHECLEKNIKNNNLGDKVELHKYGLSNINGKISYKRKDLSKHVGNYGGNMLVFLGGESLESKRLPEDTDEENVDLRTLDSLGLDNIGFIKMDVEGFEKLVLEGGLETIKKSNYPPMHIEIWPPLENDWRTETPRARKHYTETRDGIFKMMVDMGYKVVGHAGWDYLFKHF